MKARWHTRPFAECVRAVKTPSKIQRKRFLDQGKYPIVSQEADFINGYWNDDGDVIRISRPLVVFGDHTQVVKYIDFDFVVGADGVKLLEPKSFIYPRFFYYFLLAHPVKTLGYARHYRLVKQLEVRYPEDLAEQKRIVAILDEAFATIATATANAENNLANARDLFRSFRDDIFARHESDWTHEPLHALESRGIIKLGRGKVISKKDLAAHPGDYPVYSSAKNNEGKFGEYGLHMFDEEMITWSVDGGGRLFHRPKHRFSVTNVGGTMRISDESVFGYRFLYHALTMLHAKINFDWVLKAHPSIIRKLYDRIPVAPLEDQECIASAIDEVGVRTQELQSIYARKLVLLAELKQSILQKAFTGELTTEPAELVAIA